MKGDVTERDRETKILEDATLLPLNTEDGATSQEMKAASRIQKR